MHDRLDGVVEQSDDQGIPHDRPVFGQMCQDRKQQIAGKQGAEEPVSGFHFVLKNQIKVSGKSVGSGLDAANFQLPKEYDDAPDEPGDKGPDETLPEKNASAVLFVVSQKIGTADHQKNGDGPVEDTLHRQTEHPAPSRCVTMESVVVMQDQHRNTGKDIHHIEIEKAIAF